MKMAVPCPVFTFCKQIPHLLLESRKLVLRSEKLEGDFGEDGRERRKNLGLFLVVVLQWSLGLLDADAVVLIVVSAAAAVVVVLHRRLGLETG